jgi:hypothetical protein
LNPGGVDYPDKNNKVGKRTGVVAINSTVIEAEIDPYSLQLPKRRR